MSRENRARGERHGRARLRYVDVEMIWSAWERGYSYRQIAAMLDRDPPLRRSTVQSVIAGDSWWWHPASVARLGSKEMDR